MSDKPSNTQITGANGTPNPAQNPTTAQAANGAPAAVPAKSTNPYIQMLAERAATDQSLRPLMRIVAGGNASLEEFEQFQSHVDDETRQLHARSRLDLVVSRLDSVVSRLDSVVSRLDLVISSGLNTTTTQAPPTQPQALRSKDPTHPTASKSLEVLLAEVSDEPSTTPPVESKSPEELTEQSKLVKSEERPTTPGLFIMFSQEEMEDYVSGKEKLMALVDEAIREREEKMTDGELDARF